MGKIVFLFLNSAKRSSHVEVGTGYWIIEAELWLLKRSTQIIYRSQCSSMLVCCTTYLNISSGGNSFPQNHCDELLAGHLTPNILVCEKQSWNPFSDGIGWHTVDRNSQHPLAHLRYHYSHRWVHWLQIVIKHPLALDWVLTSTFDLI